MTEKRRLDTAGIANNHAYDRAVSVEKSKSFGGVNEDHLAVLKLGNEEVLADLLGHYLPRQEQAYGRIGVLTFPYLTQILTYYQSL